jgi:hypothetical protein
VRGLEHMVISDLEVISDRDRRSSKTGKERQVPHTSTLTRNPYISFGVNRRINVAAPEFKSIEAFQQALGKANNALSQKDSSQEFRRNNTTFVEATDIHITHIYAFEAHELLMAHFGDDKGGFERPKKLVDRLRRVGDRYNQWIAEKNKAQQDKVVRELGFFATLGKASSDGLPQEDLRDHEALSLLSGSYEIESSLAAYRSGRVWGFDFTSSAHSFLREENAKSLDFITDKLGIASVDASLEERILGYRHHATVLRKGRLDPSPHTVMYPKDHYDEPMELPLQLVTELDPTMSVIYKKYDS